MARKKRYWVYTLTNTWHTVLYTGIPNNVERRITEHKSGKGGNFTRKYNANKLVYVVTAGNVRDAIKREKQIKAGSREKKFALINAANPEWRDLLKD